MYQAIDFYSDDNSRRDAPPQRGQMFWTCYPFSFENREIGRYFKGMDAITIDVSKFDPSEERPDHDSKTENDEFWGIVKFKRRPVIVLSTPGSSYQDRAWKGGEHVIAAPIYSLRNSKTGEWRCSREFALNAVKYAYSSVFFLPASTEHGIIDSVVRFDRAKGLHVSWLFERRSALLTPEAIRCMEEWFQFYMTGQIRKPFLDELREYQKAIEQSPGTIEALYPKR